MMRVKFWCDSGANIHSMRQEVFSTEQLGYSDEEWATLTDEEKYAEAEQWAWQRLEFGYTEI